MFSFARVQDKLDYDDEKVLGGEWAVILTRECSRRSIIHPCIHVLQLQCVLVLEPEEKWRGEESRGRLIFSGAVTGQRDCKGLRRQAWKNLPWNRNVFLLMLICRLPLSHIPRLVSLKHFKVQWLSRWVSCIMIRAPAASGVTTHRLPCLRMTLAATAATSPRLIQIGRKKGFELTARN